MTLRLFRWTLLALIFSIPLGAKKFLFTFATPFSNFYTSEYTSAFLFGADLLLAAAAVFAWRSRFRVEWPAVPAAARWSLAAFSAAVLGSLAFAAYPAFSAYRLLHVAFAVGVGVLTAGALGGGVVTLRHLAGALGASAVFQSLVGLGQFFTQGSIGLRWLGETAVLGPYAPGVAGIAAEGGIQYLRAYGTLPHANILAGFLVLGLISLGFLFVTSTRAASRAILAAGTTIALAGLLVTFSRSGWIVGLVAFIFFLGLSLSRREYRRRTGAFALVVVCALAFLVSALGFAVVPRASFSADEAPVRDRWVYNKLGIALIGEHPEGVGIGNQLFYSFDRGMFREFGLTARGQWQPIHNLYLLIAAETGVLGLLIFLLLIASPFIHFKFQNQNFKQIPNSNTGKKLFGAWNFESGISAIMLFALLLFGLFDHFLWDLNAGRLMFGAVVGMTWGVRLRMGESLEGA